MPGPDNNANFTGIMQEHIFDRGWLYGPIASDMMEANDLVELALDMRWSWNHEADDVWKELDAELWQSTHNPWAVLQTVSRQRLQELLDRPDFKNQVSRLLTAKKNVLAGPAWFQQNYPLSPLSA